MEQYKVRWNSTAPRSSEMEQYRRMLSAFTASPVHRLLVGMLGGLCAAAGAAHPQPVGRPVDATLGSLSGAGAQQLDRFSGLYGSTKAKLTDF